MQAESHMNNDFVIKVVSTVKDVLGVQFSLFIKYM